MRVEENAGISAEFTNRDYESAGATLVDAKSALAADIILKIRPLQKQEIPNVCFKSFLSDFGALKQGLLQIRDHATVIGFMQPAANKEMIELLQVCTHQFDTQQKISVVNFINCVQSSIENKLWFIEMLRFLAACSLYRSFR